MFFFDESFCQVNLFVYIQDEEDIDIDGTPSVVTGKRRPNASKKKAGKSSAVRSSQANNKAGQFPSARGLVGKW